MSNYLPHKDTINPRTGKVRTTSTPTHDTDEDPTHDPGYQALLDEVMTLTGHPRSYFTGMRASRTYLETRLGAEGRMRGTTDAKPNPKRPRGRIYWGVVSQVHEDRLFRHAGTGEGVSQHLDEKELARIVPHLAGVPIVAPANQTTGHPHALTTESGAPTQAPHRVVGQILSAHLDGEYAIAEILIVDERTLDAIDGGTTGLSLGGWWSLDRDNYQRGTRVDHLSIARVPCAGEDCRLFLSAQGRYPGPQEVHVDGSLDATVKRIRRQRTRTPAQVIRDEIAAEAKAKRAEPKPTVRTSARATEQAARKQMEADMRNGRTTTPRTTAPYRAPKPARTTRSAQNEAEKAAVQKLNADMVRASTNANRKGSH